jgi:UDP-glucose 4-epimerase
LVTGGEGFLGSRVVHRLLDVGCVVTSVDNLSTARADGAGLTSNPRLDLVRLDIRDRSAVERTLEGVAPRVIFHLAALHFIPACNAEPATTLEINVVGTQIVVDACKRLPVRPTFVLASTADVYATTTEPLGESSPLGPSNIYGLSKLAAEGVVRLAAASQQCDAVICRLFNLYGAHETNPHVIPEIVKQLRSGDEVVLGNTKPRRDFVDVGDAADALVALAERAPLGSTVNVGTGQSYSVDDVIDMISKLTGRQIEVSTDPSRWRPTDRENLQCDNRLLRSFVPQALSTSLLEGLRELLVGEGLLT